MQTPERFSNAPPYSFVRLRALLDPVTPGQSPIAMSLGEPNHAFPDWIGSEIAAHAHEFGNYPPNNGAPELLEAISGWITRRYGVDVDPDTRLMALNGTREGLFNSAIALCPEQKNGVRPAILIPNPFYQVYSTAALTCAAEPVYVPATAETGFLPNYASLPTELLERTAIVYLCSPANPQGVVAPESYWRTLLDLAEKHDFLIFADECYSEVYRDTPPPGVLEVAHAAGADPERVVAFHSLSKRSSVPGLRSGFVAAGPKAMSAIRGLRAYAGAPVPMPIQRASIRLWNDETHVEESRAQYVRKFKIADEVMGNVPGYTSPEAGFFLWLPVENGEAATLQLWRDFGVRVLPGAYLSRDTETGNPGDGYIRAALVASEDDVRRGLERVRDCLFA